MRNEREGGSELARQGKVPAFKPEDPSSIPRTHKVEGKNQLWLVPLTFTHAPWSNKERKNDRQVETNGGFRKRVHRDKLAASIGFSI